MRIVGICASHSKRRSSYRLLEEAMKGVREVDSSIETKIIEFVELKIGPCIVTCADSGTCGKPPFECIVRDDFQMVFNDMKSSDGILIASPRYFIVPSKLQAFIERLYCANYSTKRVNPTATHPLADKPIGFLTVSGSGGYSTISLLEHLEKLALWLHMKPVATKTFPFIGVVGRDPVTDDPQALQRAKTMGQTIAKAIRENK